MKANKNLVSLSIVGVVTTIVAFSAGYFVIDLFHSRATATLASESHDRTALAQPDRMSALTRSGRSDALVDVSDLEDLARFKSHFRPERTAAGRNDGLTSSTPGAVKGHWLNQSTRISAAGDFSANGNVQPKVGIGADEQSAD